MGSTYNYEIVEREDGRFTVYLVGYTFREVKAVHSSLSGAVAHCQEHMQGTPYWVVWYKEPKKSKDDEAFEEACREWAPSSSLTLRPLLRLLWKAGVKFGRQNPNPTKSQPSPSAVAPSLPSSYELRLRCCPSCHRLTPKC